MAGRVDLACQPALLGAQHLMGMAAMQSVSLSQHTASVSQLDGSMTGFTMFKCGLSQQAAYLLCRAPSTPATSTWCKGSTPSSPRCLGCPATRVLHELWRQAAM